MGNSREPLTGPRNDPWEHPWPRSAKTRNDRDFSVLDPECGATSVYNRIWEAPAGASGAG